MSKKVRSWKERIGAMLLAFALVVSWMLPNASVTAKAAGTADVISVYRIQRIPMHFCRKILQSLCWMEVYK